MTKAISHTVRITISEIAIYGTDLRYPNAGINQTESKQNLKKTINLMTLVHDSNYFYIILQDNCKYIY